MQNTIPGFMLTEECKLLGKIFSKYNKTDTIGVEIGSFLGRSAFEIANSISLGKLYCIDKWNEWEVGEPSRFSVPDNKPVKGTRCSLETFLENTKECKNITPIKGFSPECVSDWSTKIDFVFLDALHRNPSDRRSIDFWLPKLKTGGMFAGHDYYPSYPNLYPDILENVKHIEELLGKSVTFPNIGSIWWFDIE